MFRGVRAFTNLVQSAQVARLARLSAVRTVRVSSHVLKVQSPINFKSTNPLPYMPFAHRAFATNTAGPKDTEDHVEITSVTGEFVDDNHYGLRVAMILSGSGYLDGTEITEAISAMIHLTANGCIPTCFAPNKDYPAVNHLNASPYVQEDGATPVTRNAMQEAARIARGKVYPLDKLDPSAFDALFIPGGFGAAKNLSTFGMQGADMTVDPDVESVIRAFHDARKPIGLVCIAPVLVSKVLKSKATVTMGGETDNGGEWPFAGATDAVRAMGAKHVPTTLEDICIDRSARLVTGPAYMSGIAEPHQVFDNVGKVVDGLIALAQEEVH